MDSHLFAIENKIDSLSEQITQATAISYYKSKAESIEVIQICFQRHTSMQTET